MNMENPQIILGNIIREYLDTNNISITDFSYRVGVSRKHMSNLVNGKCRLEWEVAGRLAESTYMSAGYWLTLQAYVDTIVLEKRKGL